uniref:C3H1-type domain-containing protein n=1 Tax=Noctiluca scintillans TaxID=2966 RepID=A0A7S1AR39_NOCSC|mmetsp:Transcript_56120/g.149753  ORF Transcript_56120/g.149753 Transcript_56120/m.149753 type:complete len:578 (+) Transcript_56120:139-1872(+)
MEPAVDGDVLHVEVSNLCALDSDDLLVPPSAGARQTLPESSREPVDKETAELTRERPNKTPPEELVNTDTSPQEVYMELPAELHVRLPADLGQELLVESRVMPPVELPLQQPLEQRVTTPAELPTQVPAEVPADQRKDRPDKAPTWTMALSKTRRDEIVLDDGDDDEETQMLLEEFLDEEVTEAEMLLAKQELAAEQALPAVRAGLGLCAQPVPFAPETSSVNAAAGKTAPPQREAQVPPKRRRIAFQEDSSVHQDAANSKVEPVQASEAEPRPLGIASKAGALRRRTSASVQHARAKVLPSSGRPEPPKITKDDLLEEVRKLRLLQAKHQKQGAPRQVARREEVDAPSESKSASVQDFVAAFTRHATSKLTGPQKPLPKQPALPPPPPSSRRESDVEVGSRPGVVIGKIGREMHGRADDEVEARGSNGRVCKYFASGACKKGDHCDFEHHVVVPRTAQVIQPCKYFAIGFCKKGDDCDFQHAAPVWSAPGAKAACKYFAAGFCKKGDNCDFSHTEPSELQQEEVDAISDILEAWGSIDITHLTTKFKGLTKEQLEHHFVLSRQRSSEGETWFVSLS